MGDGLTVRDQLAAIIADHWLGDCRQSERHGPDTCCADVVLAWLDTLGIQLDRDADPALIRTHTRAGRATD